MPILIQDINFTLTDIISDNLNGIQDVSFSVYETVCNHISAPGLEGYFFNFSNVHNCLKQSVFFFRKIEI